jgi:hypothetical protein
MDAIEICVRGFGTQSIGNQVVAILDKMGFTIKEQIDGASDSMGGIIETSIEKTDNLDFVDVATATKQLRIIPKITVEFNTYRTE